MGTSVTAKIAGARIGEIGAAAARDAVAGALDAVVANMSTYLPDSELSRFNRHSAGAPFALSADTLAVLALAQQVSAASDGAFDITIAGWSMLGVRPEQGASRGLRGAALATRRLAALPSTRRRDGHQERHTGVRADLSGIASFCRRPARAGCPASPTTWSSRGEIRTRGKNAEGPVADDRGPDATPQRPHFMCRCRLVGDPRS
jgi:thiamine biosynthesis lipoprotein ApbE